MYNCEERVVCFYFNFFFFEEGSHCEDQAELTLKRRLIQTRHPPASIFLVLE